ncbi:MAG TPA: DNA polymerase III subunit gamma/tau [Vicinamibacterales bacterium]|jgi:DNA polymerase-3 subunit gamma/tau|nr:DNA polymerase III subunit gamma/tau [Vicinamibacterales bacterium]
MSYQVLARKWRPQRFDDVIGQRGVTQTLRNAINAGRIAQSFVFAGPRGVGKTTTARILARALNCENGPTPDPCGVCDACVEIAQGRDMDVLEIDAATNTQVDKVREVIIAGLGMAPVRDRYKVFIIDEVHRLSNNAFDALLKSIEEPPPHVVFMMATTELEKVPATIQSRSQVFELKTIGVKQIADQLRKIADAEKIGVDEAALMLVARAGDGSMRDAQSAFDQVIAFADRTVTPEDVSAVLGLVRRDLLIAMADAVAREDATAVFALAAQVSESGSDLRSVIRELARLTRDLMVLSIDPSRASDPEIAAESERAPLLDLAKQFSREDLLRAFDVLTKAEYDIRASLQPRYHLEMALLRWIHVRKLVPLAELMQQIGSSAAPRPAVSATAPGPSGSAATPAPSRATPAPAAVAARRVGDSSPAAASRAAKPQPSPATTDSAPELKAVTAGEFKEAFLGETRRAKKFFYGTVVAQAKIDFDPDRVVFAFTPQHRALRAQFEQLRPWLEATASQLAGRRMAVVSVENSAPATTSARGPGPHAEGAPATDTRRDALKERALAEPNVQAMLDVFAAEITDVEER